MVNILFFAQVREKLEQDYVEFDLNTAISINQLVDSLVQKDERFNYLKQPHLFVALNQTLCDRTQVVNDGDELAFFPAVTGG